MAKFRFGLLDGGLVDVETALPRGPESCNAGVELRDLGIGQYLLAGPLRLARHYALSPSLSDGMQLQYEFSYQGGTLWLGSGTQMTGPDGAEYAEVGLDGEIRPARVHMAAWEGENHSLLLPRYTGETLELLAILEHFFITETPDGVQCIPRDRSLTLYVSSPTILLDMPDFALLDIRQLTPQVSGALPKGAGTPVRGGELFVSGGTSPHMHLVLVGETTVTYIMPEDVPEDRLMAGAEDLFVSGQWGPG